MLFQILLVCSVLALKVNAQIQLEMKKYGMCDEFPNTPIQIQTNYTKYNSTVYFIDLKADSPYDIGNNTMIHVMIQMYEDNEWTTVIKIDERDPCKLMNEYGGPMMAEIEKKMNITPEKCPIPKGVYELKNFLLDFDQLSITTIPKGLIRVLSNTTQDDELLLCFHTEFNSL